MLKVELSWNQIRINSNNHFLWEEGREKNKLVKKKGKSKRKEDVAYKCITVKRYGNSHVDRILQNEVEGNKREETER